MVQSSKQSPKASVGSWRIPWIPSVPRVQFLYDVELENEGASRCDRSEPASVFVSKLANQTRKQSLHPIAEPFWEVQMSRII